VRDLKRSSGGRSEQVNEYLRRARRARENAEQASNEESRAAWLKVAAQWEELAKKTAQGPKLD
jgi:hypothetical protein